ncbi:hypothetical protein, partial [Escherichia coli]|uniref:hypothetical protein n=1 Tax=Escherichia coli TaxID=562 RepID=UPI001BD2528E
CGSIGASLPAFDPQPAISARFSHQLMLFKSPRQFIPLTAVRLPSISHTKQTCGSIGASLPAFDPQPAISARFSHQLMLFKSPRQ